MPALSESDVTSQIRHFLECRGWRAVRMNRGLMQTPVSVVQFGEPGMADWLYYRPLRHERIPCVALVLWIEMKATGARAKCRCLTKRPRQRCTACDQGNWAERERARGGVVWIVDSLDWFIREYEATFAWLHRGDRARGQVELALEGK